MTHTYFRSVTRWDGPRALLKLPRADRLVAGRRYEIRDTDKVTVLARDVSGAAILEAREKQLQAYLREDPARTNTAMVDISHLISNRSAVATAGRSSAV